jgi:hypothetical protein
MRKHIFEILSEHFDLDKEIQIIWELFSSNIIGIEDSMRVRGYTLSQLLDNYGFANWKARGRAISCSDMSLRLGIESLLKKSDKDMNDAFIVLEYVMNIQKQCDGFIGRVAGRINHDYNLLWENCNLFIENFGHEIFYIEEEQKLLIVEKNSAAMAVAEISKEETAKHIIEYNHYTLKGDISRKREIILNLANEIEPQRKELRQIKPSVSDNLFFLLNNLNLRHNNVDPNNEHYKRYIAEMDSTELEKWYDETYQLILLSKLLLDDVSRDLEINMVKSKIK